MISVSMIFTVSQTRYIIHSYLMTVNFVLFHLTQHFANIIELSLGFHDHGRHVGLPTCGVWHFTNDGFIPVKLYLETYSSQTYASRSKILINWFDMTYFACYPMISKSIAIYLFQIHLLFLVHSHVTWPALDVLVQVLSQSGFKADTNLKRVANYWPIGVDLMYCVIAAGKSRMQANQRFLFLIC